MAVRSGRVDTVQLLLKHGADINARGPDGTALDAAARTGKVDIVQLLLIYGANIGTHKGCDSALSVAAEFGHDDIVQLLRDHEADINTQGPFDGSAGTIEYDDTKMAQRPVDNRADVYSAKVKWYETELTTVLFTTLLICLFSFCLWRRWRRRRRRNILTRRSLN